MMVSAANRVGRVLVIGLLAAGAPASAMANSGQSEPSAGILVETHLLRSPLTSDSGRITAEIEDLVIDPEGIVRLLVVELLAPERRTIAIPWSYVRVQEDGSIRLTAGERELLSAPLFTRSSTAEGATRGVPSEENDRELRAARATFLPTPYPVARYYPDNVRSFRGSVMGTMTAPLEGAAEEVVAIVAVGDESVEARLGPQSMLQRLDLRIEPGDTLEFEGSPSDVGGTTVVVVSKVTVGKRTFLLRDREGKLRGER